MRRWLLFLGITVAIVAFSVPSHAVLNSHHDMNSFNVSTGGKDTCYPCHGYVDTVYDNTLGRIGSLCYNRCHVGGAGSLAPDLDIVGFAPEVGTWNAPDNTVRPKALVSFTAKRKYSDEGGNHGLLASALPSNDSQGMGTDVPYRTNTSIECTSCHDPHKTDNPPFLRWSLGTLCTKCHTGTAAGGQDRYLLLTDATTVKNGAHPIEIPANTSGTALSVTTRAAGRLGRTILIKDRTLAGAQPSGSWDNAVFRNRFDNSVLQLAANTYNPGGKLSDGGAGGSTSMVGCYSCHAVHMPTEVASDGGVNNFVVAPWTADNTDRLSTLCVGCHGAGDGRNPGTTSYWHPVNGEVVSYLPQSHTPAQAASAEFDGIGWTWKIWVDLTGKDLAYNGTDNLVITCTSCHGGTDGVHGLNNATTPNMLLNTLTTNCKGCHGGGGGSATNVTMKGAGSAHHPVGGGDYTTSPFAFRSGSWQWNAGADNTANLTDGMGCSDCHIMDSWTAHNWQ